MSTVPYLLMETPNTPSGHRFLVPAGVTVDSAHAAAVCAKMTREGTFQGDAWLGVAARQVQDVLDAGRVGLARTALVGVNVARLAPSQREEILNQLTRALEDLPRITAAIDWERGGGGLVVSSDVVNDVVHTSWQSLPRLSYGSRSKPRRKISIVAVTVLVIGALVALATNQMATPMRNWSARHVDNPASVRKQDMAPPAPRHQVWAERSPPPRVDAEPKFYSPTENVPPTPKPEPMKVNLAEILVSAEGIDPLNRLAETVKSNLLGSVGPAENEKLASLLWKEAQEESAGAIPAMIKVVHRRSSELSDRRLTPAFQDVWRQLGDQVFETVNRQLATATRESNSKAIDAAVAQLPIQESLSRISADNESREWSLLGREAKALVEKRRQEAREWVDRLSKAKVKVFFDVIDSPDDRGPFARQITIESMDLLLTPEQPNNPDNMLTLEWRDNCLTLPVSQLAVGGKALIQWTYREQGGIGGGKGRPSRRTIPVSALRTRDKAERRGDFRIYLDSPLPKAPEWLKEFDVDEAPTEDLVVPPVKDQVPGILRTPAPRAAEGGKSNSPARP